MAISQQELKSANLLNLHGGGEGRFDMVVGGSLSPLVFETEVEKAGSNETLSKLGELSISQNLTNDSDH